LFGLVENTENKHCLFWNEVWLYRMRLLMDVIQRQ